MLTTVCLSGALLLTAVSLGCLSAPSGRHRRSWRVLPAAALMAVSTVAMMAPVLVPALPAGSAGWPIGWAAVMLCAALLALLNRRRRPESAMTAASSMVMALMWLAMGAAEATTSSASGVDGPVSGHLHAGAAAAPFALLLGVVAVLSAALLTALAVHTCWHQREAARGIRLASLHHPTMALGMVLMGLGMSAPAVLG
ncbi:hypothetical protein [Microterricola viridarii]|uniref:DUF5134 domain-containing protein n=1 Tax=Microterricola viridarii TaxID=412690 RepID=A0A0X8E2M3_9MICO|nr:hypothetical protein [Microterricola viridarii]AMB59335.1 hypothetical protein AWU67_11180 [Microterricola viridarii]